MPDGFTLDTSAFEHALVTYEKVTGKDLPEILNRAGKNIAYRAAQFTKPASGADIRSGLTRDENLLYALTSIRLKKKGIDTLPSPEFAKQVKKTLAGRIGSARYLRAAWAEAIEKFGGTFRGKRMHGAAAQIRKATVASLVTELAALINEPTEAKAQSAEAKLFPILQKAVDFVSDDMLEFALGKMDKAARKAGLN